MAAPPTPEGADSPTPRDCWLRPAPCRVSAAIPPAALASCPCRYLCSAACASASCPSLKEYNGTPQRSEHRRAISWPITYIANTGGIDWASPSTLIWSASMPIAFSHFCLLLCFPGRLYTASIFESQQSSGQHVSHNFRPAQSKRGIRLLHPRQHCIANFRVSKSECNGRFDSMTLGRFACNPKSRFRSVRSARMHPCAALPTTFSIAYGMSRASKTLRVAGINCGARLSVKPPPAWAIDDPALQGGEAQQTASFPKRSSRFPSMALPRTNAAAPNFATYRSMNSRSIPTGVHPNRSIPADTPPSPAKQSPTKGGTPRFILVKIFT